MAQLSILEAIEALKEKLFHVSEKKRLKEMKAHSEEREQQPHADFLSKARESDSEHAHRVEHHGANFWSYYYSGEHPVPVLRDELVEEHQYGTSEQRLAIESHMLDEKFAAYTASDETAAGEEIAVRKQWVSLVWIAETALANGNLREAEGNFRTALELAEKFGDSDLRLSRTLTGLAKSLCQQGKHEESDPLYSRALIIDEKVHGEGHTNLEQDFRNIATHYLMQGKVEEAEDLYQYVLEEWEKSVGPKHPAVARCLNDLGVILCRQGKCEAAEPLYRRALEILQYDKVPRRKQLATTLQNLATLCEMNDRIDEAQSLYTQAITLLEESEREQEELSNAQISKR